MVILDAGVVFPVLGHKSLFVISRKVIRKERFQMPRKVFKLYKNKRIYSDLIFFFNFPKIEQQRLWL